MGRKERRARICMAILVVLCALLPGCASIGGEKASADASWTWDPTEAPNYYEVVGPASFDSLPDVGRVSYASLDGLGRSGRVVACIDYTLMQEGTEREREDMRNVKPSGWGHNEKVSIELPTGGRYNGYFWNRSHLLAKSLGGLDDIQNLVCGTRMQNVGANAHGAEGGMAYVETLAREWLYDHPHGCVYYAAEPRYVGNEAVCRAVVVDVRTSDGSLDQEVVVYNAAKGYAIDYATGAFWRE